MRDLNIEAFHGMHVHCDVHPGERDLGLGAQFFDCGG